MSPEFVYMIEMAGSAAIGSYLGVFASAAISDWGAARARRRALQVSTVNACVDVMAEDIVKLRPVIQISAEDHTAEPLSRAQQLAADLSRRTAHIASIDDFGPMSIMECDTVLSPVAKQVAQEKLREFIRRHPELRGKQNRFRMSKGVVSLAPIADHNALVSCRTVNGKLIQILSAPLDDFVSRQLDQAIEGLGQSNTLFDEGDYFQLVGLELRKQPKGF